MKTKNNRIKYLSIILLLVITNIVHASQNKYIDNGSEKELEIIEEYEIGYNVSNVNVNKSNNNDKIKIEIKAKISPKDSYVYNQSSNVEVNNNIKKTSNENYSLNDIYIIGLSEPISKLQSKWYRKVTNSSNIGKGSIIKNNNDIIINRNYGLGNDENIQNAPIYTSNKVINSIAGYDLLNDLNIEKHSISTSNNEYSLSFSFTIDKDKIQEVRYIYIGTNENISKQDNTVSYKSIISEHIDITNTVSIDKDDDIEGINNSIFGFPEEENTNNETTNYYVSKAYEELKMLDTGGNTHTSMAQEYNLGAFTIKDSDQNPATLSEIKKLKLRQDNDYYYFDFDLIYENKNIQVNDISKVGNCILYVSNSSNDSLNYEYTTYAHVNSWQDWGVGKAGFVNSYDRENPIPAYQYQSLSIDTNKKQGIQTMTNTSIKTASSNPIQVTFTPTENIIKNYPEYSSLIYPFESYLGAYKSGIRSARGIDPIVAYIPNGTSQPTNGSLYSIWSYPMSAMVTAQVLWTNGQQNKLMPIKPTYNMVNITSQTIDTNKTYWNKELVGTIKINKNDIANYQYINMYAPEGIISSKNFNDVLEGSSSYSDSSVYVSGKASSSAYKASVNYCPAKEETAMSFHSNISSNNLLNLNELSHCDHKWNIIYCDDVKHIMKCSKCEWEKNENHNYQYEYDGIVNDICECGKIHIIKNHYNFNSDLVADIVEEFDANTTIATKSSPIKTGYIFKNYSVYHKIPNNYNATNTPLTEKYINTINELPSRTATYSTIFKTNYDPIKYKFIFKNDNNLKLNINGNVPDQEYEYDEKKSINNGININNYYFKGWSLATNSIIVFTPSQAVKNYTAIHNQEITLYPNYEPLIFTINYKTELGSYSNGALSLTKSYNLIQNSNPSLEIPILNQKVVETKSGQYTYDIYTTNYNFIEYQDELGNKYNNINQILELVKKNIISNNMIINLKAIVTQNTNKSYRESGGGTGGVTKEDLGLEINPKEETKDLIPSIINNVMNIFKEKPNTNSKKNKDIVEYITEVYNDYISNNNIKEVAKEDIIDFISKVYEDYINEQDEDNQVIGFINTLLSTKSKLSEIKNKTNNKSTKITTKSETDTKSKKINDIDYIDKIFDTNKEKLYINNLLKDINKRDYYKTYDDFYVGKYKSMIDDLLKKYNGISKNLKKEFSKNKYKKFNNDFKAELKKEEYQFLYKDLLNAIENNKKDYKEITEYLNKFEYIKLITNFNNGKYKDISNDLFDVIFNEKYNLERTEIENLLTEGKFNEIFYDVIYNILDITYNYEPVKEEKVEIQIATKPVIEKPIIEVETTEVKKENFNILPIILIICSIIVIWIAIILVIRARNNKEE